MGLGIGKVFKSIGRRVEKEAKKAVSDPMKLITGPLSTAGFTTGAAQGILGGGGIAGGIQGGLGGAGDVMSMIGISPELFQAQQEQFGPGGGTDQDDLDALKRRVSQQTSERRRFLSGSYGSGGSSGRSLLGY